MRKSWAHDATGARTFEARCGQAAAEVDVANATAPAWTRMRTTTDIGKIRPTRGIRCQCVSAANVTPAERPSTRVV
eukprot:1353484-Pyramimonas_sp.AAC.1